MFFYIGKNGDTNSLFNKSSGIFDSFVKLDFLDLK